MGDTLTNRRLEKSKSAVLCISVRPAVTPYQQFPSQHFAVGLDRRASRGLFKQPTIGSGKPNQRDQEAYTDVSPIRNTCP